MPTWRMCRFFGPRWSWVFRKRRNNYQPNFKKTTGIEGGLMTTGKIMVNDDKKLLKVYIKGA